MRPISSATGMKASGDTVPRSWMLPTGKGLKPHHDPGRELDDRLELKVELHPFEPMAEVGLEFAAPLNGVVHRGFERDVAALSGRLGTVHGDVSIPEHLFGGSPLAVHCDPDARRELDAVAFELERLGQGPQDALGALTRLRGPGHVLEEHGEFVPSEPRDRVGRTNDAPQSIAYFDQERVACAVAKRVIHLLEFVQIDEQDREPTRPHGP